jgi:hypothetical protein
MKSTKILALIVSTITLFPSASWADEMSINQRTNVNSTITGNGRVIRIETSDQSNQSHQLDRYDCKNTRLIYHKNNGRATSIGAMSSLRKRFRKQLMDKLMREQIINQRTQIDD